MDVWIVRERLWNIMRTSECSHSTVWSWQASSAHENLEGHFSDRSSQEALTCVTSRYLPSAAKWIVITFYNNWLTWRNPIYDAYFHQLIYKVSTQRLSSPFLAYQARNLSIVCFLVFAWMDQSTIFLVRKEVIFPVLFDSTHTLAVV